MLSSLPLRVTSLTLPLKSYRVRTSFIVCWTALSTSCRSTLETMSKEHSDAMKRLTLAEVRRDDQGKRSRAGRGASRAPRGPSRRVGGVAREAEERVGEAAVRLQVLEVEPQAVAARIHDDDLADHQVRAPDAQEQVLVVVRERDGIETQDGSLGLGTGLEARGEGSAERRAAREQRADPRGPVSRSQIVAGDLRVSLDDHLRLPPPDTHHLALGIRVLPSPEIGTLERDPARFARRARSRPALGGLDEARLEVLVRLEAAKHLLEQGLRGVVRAAGGRGRGPRPRLRLVRGTRRRARHAQDGE